MGDLSNHSTLQMENWGGLAGTEAALELAMQGKQVTLVEMGIDVARDANSIHKPALMMELKDHAEQVTILCRTTCTGIHDHGIVCRDADGRELTLDADTVILAAAHVLLADQGDVGRLDHGIGRLDRADQTFCLDHTQSLHHIRHL